MAHSGGVPGHRRPPVTSVFGRIGAVVAETGDYAGTQVTYSGSVTGATNVTQAIDLLNSKSAAGVFNTQGQVLRANASGEAEALNIGGSGDVLTSNGTTVVWSAPVTAPVSSVYGRTGVVVAQLGDYDGSQVTYIGSVPGSTVTQALNNLNSTKQDNVITVQGQLIVADGSGDPSALNLGVSGQVLTSNGTTAVWATSPTAPVTSVYGRVGAVVAQSGDYAGTQVTYSGSVTGATNVTQAIDLLNSGSASGVFTTQGQVLRANASGDAEALNIGGSGDVLTSNGTTVVWSAPAVAPVSSVYGRTGAVVAQTGDYNSAQVTYTGTVAAANVQGAINTLDTTKQDDVITTQGQLIVGTAGGDPSALAIGTSGQVLTSNGTTASWGAAPSVINTQGQLIVGDGSGDPSALAIGTSGQVLTSNGTTAAWGAVPSVITTQGDLIVGNAGGNAVRLPVGANLNVLGVIAGVPTWVTADVVNTEWTRMLTNRSDNINNTIGVLYFGTDPTGTNADAASTSARGVISGLGFEDAVVSPLGQSGTINTIRLVTAAATVNQGTVGPSPQLTIQISQINYTGQTLIANVQLDYVSGTIQTFSTLAKIDSVVFEATGLSVVIPPDTFWGACFINNNTTNNNISGVSQMFMGIMGNT